MRVGPDHRSACHYANDLARLPELAAARALGEVPRHDNHVRLQTGHRGYKRSKDGHIDVPEMEVELGMVSELLSGILVDAAQVGSYTINFESANEEAVHIIEETSVTVGQKITEEYLPIPELPMMPIKFIQTGSGSVAS